MLAIIQQKVYTKNMGRIVLFLLASSIAIAQTPSESLKRLLEGNQRYVNDQLTHPNHSSDRREEISAGQKPFATILGCSDSRVAPEIIFDQGLGDLFIVRDAGNIAGPIELNSIDYSVKYLGSSLVVVMGHESCGAVTAVVQGTTADIEAVAKIIRPAVKGITNPEMAIKANVKAVVAELRKNKIISQWIKEGKIDCIGAYYHLGSGEVELLK
ncbi:MAG TPA: carbonic anhydrase [Chlamydiales bacterium]|nr:carbonic anhydrase [Chlamydiales bacterium]